MIEQNRPIFDRMPGMLSDGCKNRITSTHLNPFTLKSEELFIDYSDER